MTVLPYRSEIEQQRVIIFKHVHDRDLPMQEFYVFVIFQVNPNRIAGMFCEKILSTWYLQQVLLPEI